jgi:hypothetical protein
MTIEHFLSGHNATYSANNWLVVQYRFYSYFHWVIYLLFLPFCALVALFLVLFHVVYCNWWWERKENESICRRKEKGPRRNPFFPSRYASLPSKVERTQEATWTLKMTKQNQRYISIPDRQKTDSRAIFKIHQCRGIKGMDKVSNQREVYIRRTTLVMAVLYAQLNNRCR